ncbi:hypothetical protein CP02DC16_1024A, partial [Chlamydia psittaci 02DC16]
MYCIKAKFSNSLYDVQERSYPPPPPP